VVAGIVALVHDKVYISTPEYRVVGIGFGLLSMAIRFLLIPLNPIWSFLMIALDIGEIFALATYRRVAL
jgi:hypothetical protein